MNTPTIAVQSEDEYQGRQSDDDQIMTAWTRDVMREDMRDSTGSVDEI